MDTTRAGNEVCMSTIKRGEFIMGDGLPEAVNGKTLINVLQYSRSSDDFLTLVFTDGTSLEIRYDWPYEWELVDHDVKLNENFKEN
jgi:hypothetical protein